MFKYRLKKVIKVLLPIDLYVSISTLIRLTLCKHVYKTFYKVLDDSNLILNVLAYTLMYGVQVEIVATSLAMTK